MNDHSLSHSPSGEPNSQLAESFHRVADTVRVLVNDGGCAWHREQTHASLTPYLVEEAAELVEAIDTHQPADEVVSELADVLYQVLFHAVIAERDAEGYGLQTVTEHLNQKLVARHPHVFGDRGQMTVDELNAEWEHLKEAAAGQRSGSRGVLEGIPVGMPTLAKAAKVVSRAKRAGTWRDPVLLSATSGGDSPGTLRGSQTGELSEDAAQIGMELLQLVERAYTLGVDADRALRVQLARHAVTLGGVNEPESMEE